jgi:beta-glucosidase
LDSSLPLKDRVQDLVSRLTLDEKISQTLYDAPAIPRLGVPAYNWWNECLHGVARAGLATVYPQAIGLAATWDIDLISEMATAISDEARAKHHRALQLGIRDIYAGLTFWSPNVNIFRDPRWGRGQETYGECPYLTAQIGVAFVKGLQGDDPKYLKLVATPKHFAVHSGPEPDRHTFDAVVDERDLRQTYLPHFEATVVEGGAVSIMGAYNRTNGEPCCASPTLLQEILRQEWGFGGADGSEAYVVSDCGAIADIYAHHKVVETAAEAAALAVKNGCDLNCGATYPALRDAVKQGLIDEATIERSVTRLFTARFRLGMFDPPEQVPYAQIPYSVVDSEAHRALAERVARASIVLLKNEGKALPLSKKLSSIAVIGPNADQAVALLGNYNGTPSRAVTPLQGIRDLLSGTETVVYSAQGCDLAEGIPVLRPVPSTCLRPADADAGQYGLSARYYANPRFEGPPMLSRVDPTIDFVWKGDSPLSGRWGDPFSVCWSGALVPATSGTYRLGLSGFSAFRIALDGVDLAKYKDVHHARFAGRDIKLEAGRHYDLQIEYTNRGLDPQAQLLWAMREQDHLSQALEVARRAEVVVLVLGLTANLEGEEMPVHVPGFSGGDRTDLGLPGPQQALLAKVCALNKPTVLVLMNGSAMGITWADEHVPAIVEAWYPGQAGGKALAEVLFGETNPGGRLPVTFYRSTEDLPSFEDYAMEGHTYRYFRGEPLYAFGHGLSYTTFAYHNLRLSGKRLAPGDSLTVSVEVENTGTRAGDEVVQVYLTDVEASVPVPIRQLVAFRRVHLEAGERRALSFVLTPDQFSTIDEQGKRAIEPGRFKIAVGGRQPSAQELA